MPNRTEKKQDPSVYIIAFLVIVGLFTLGWNYGVTEFIENLGGPDANVNYLEAGLALVGLRTIGRVWN